MDVEEELAALVDEEEDAEEDEELAALAHASEMAVSEEVVEVDAIVDEAKEGRL